MSEPINNKFAKALVIQLLPPESPLIKVFDESVATYHPDVKTITVDYGDEHEVIMTDKLSPLLSSVTLAKKEAWPYVVIKGDALGIHIFLEDLKYMGVNINYEGVPESLQFGMHYSAYYSRSASIYAFSVADETDRAIFAFYCSNRLVNLDPYNDIDLDGIDPSDIGMEYDKYEELRDLTNLINKAL